MAAPEYKGSSTGNATPNLTINIGAAGNHRLILAYLSDESKPGSSFQGTVTVDGKSFTQAKVVEETDGAGNHSELHTIDEAALGSSNGSLNVSYSGGDAGWTLIVEVWYGIADDTMTDSGTATVVGAAGISVTDIDSSDGSLVVMMASHGTGGSAYTTWTSTLTEREELEGGSHQHASASEFETTGQIGKTYTADNDSALTRQTAIVAVFDSAPTVSDVTSDKANATYGAGEEIYICTEFDDQVEVTGTPQLDLDVKAGGRKVDHVGNWTPAELSSSVLEAWIDASDTDQITESGGLVSQIDDKSGNNLDFSQGTGSLQPETGVGTINGLNYLEFDLDAMDTSSNPFSAGGVVDAFVFFVLRVPSSPNNGNLFSLTGSGATSSRWQSHCPWAGDRVYFDTGGTDEGTTRIKVDPLLSSSELVLMGFYGSDTDEVMELWKNGTVAGSNASGHTVSTVGNITLGYAGGTSYQSTDFCEMLILSGTVDTTTREKIEGYLAWKWGLVSSLPGGHTYKDRPPLLS